MMRLTTTLHSVSILLFIMASCVLSDNTQNEEDCTDCVGSCCYKTTDDCREYIVCAKTASSSGAPNNSTYTPIRQLCAFGTFFDDKKKVCDLPKNVKCKDDPCQTKDPGYKYADPQGSNCRAYWSCGSHNYSEAACCEKGYKFNSTDCVEDEEKSCQVNCPQGVCEGQNSEADFLDDGNCLTYFVCAKDSSPQPKCCENGTTFDFISNKCVDGTCGDTCPPDYDTDPCNETTSYKIVGNRCRTYMKCGDKNTLSCCERGEVYDKQSPTLCRNKTESDDCLDDCPFGYKQNCHLREVEGTEGGEFYHENTPNIIINSPDGTRFSQQLCGLERLNSNDPDSACPMKLDIKFTFPNVTRTGQDKMTFIEWIGNKTQESSVDDDYTFFDGSLMQMPVTMQAMDKMFLHVVFKTNSTGLLISNCGLSPTFELKLVNDGETGLIVVNVTTEGQTGPVSLSVTYGITDVNDVYVLYDGTRLELFAAHGQEAYCNSSTSLKGPIKMTCSGLALGGCPDRSSKVKEGYFIGDIATFQWSTCIKNSFLPDDILSSREAGR